MRDSSKFNKPQKKYKPDWLFFFTTLTVTIFILVSQWTAVRAYYETWVQRLPKQQVLEGVSQKKIELDEPSNEVQDINPVSTLDESPLLPSYLDEELVVQASETPSPLATQSSTVQPDGLVESYNEEALAPDRLVIPAIKVDAEVTSISPERVTTSEGSSQLTWPVPPADKAGWHSTSAKFGDRGNIVINGHNYPQNAVFRSLYKLQPGDKILLYSKEHLIEYTVIEILVLPEKGQSLDVRRANARYIQATKDERLTLVTCHPYASLANRLIVIAMPVKNLIEIMN